MTKKNKTTQKTETSVIVNHETAVPAAEEDTAFTSWRASLAEINKCKGVTGYILRNPASAILDFKDPAKIFEYAILSSQALDSSKELSELFNLGEIENLLIEGKNAKVLCLTTGENRISIFMEKNADQANILNKISQCFPKDSSPTFLNSRQNYS
jgi:predicted regulator of Ras-like GTPase activity (Roadblock/LC7/MglB family)